MLNFFLKRGNSPIPFQSKWNYIVFVSYPSQGGQRNKNKQKRKCGRGEKPAFLSLTLKLECSANNLTH